MLHVSQGLMVDHRGKRIAATSLFAALALAGCGSSGSATTGSVGGGSSVASTGSVDATSSSGGIGGANTGAGGGDPCTMPALTAVGLTLWVADHFPIPDIDDAPGGATFSCDGTVVADEPGVLALETPITATCSGPFRMKLGGTELPLGSPPVGAFVNVRLIHTWGFGATKDVFFPRLHLVIRNLSSLGGKANPVDASENLWLALGTGFVEGGPNQITAADDPFLVERVDHCSDKPTYDSIEALRFSMPNGDTKPELLSGQHAQIQVMAGGKTVAYRVQTHKAVVTTTAPEDFGYTIGRLP
jgi:hypothetical protein